MTRLWGRRDFVTAVCVSIERVLQNTAPIRCLPFDGIGARHCGMARVLEPGPGQTAVTATRPASVPDWCAVGFYRAFCHSLPLSLCERRRGCVSYDLFSFVILSYAGNLFIYLLGTFTWSLVETTFPCPRWQRSSRAIRNIHHVEFR